MVYGLTVLWVRGRQCPPGGGCRPSARGGVPVYKTDGSLQSIKSCFCQLFIELYTFLYKTKVEIGITSMQKNPGENFSTVEVDPVTGEYVIKVPEWFISEFGWYEGTEINMEVDGDSIVITEL